MGQRSQIYVVAKKDNKYYLTANYYQWNYGERMILSGGRIKNGR